MQDKDDEGGEGDEHDDDPLVSMFEALEENAEEEAAEKARASKARTGPNASLLLH